MAALPLMFRPGCRLVPILRVASPAEEPRRTRKPPTDPALLISPTIHNRWETLWLELAGSQWKIELPDRRAYRDRALCQTDERTSPCGHYRRPRIVALQLPSKRTKRRSRCIVCFSYRRGFRVELESVSYTHLRAHETPEHL